MKIKLTSEQRCFLKQMEIDENKVFNASNMPRSPKEYGPLMEGSGATIAWGVSPCLAHGHQLRDKHGHCVMCHPLTLVHAKRFQTEAYVYVAYSASEKLVKVGYSANPNDRLRQMILHKTGMTTDWEILEYIKCKYAGSVEAEVHRALERFQVTVEYGAKKGASKELFRCGGRSAVSALRNEVTKQNARQFDSLKLLLDLIDADSTYGNGIDPSELDEYRKEYKTLKNAIKNP